MSKTFTLVGGIKGLFIPCVTEDGAINLDAMRANFEEMAAKGAAEESTDFETVAAEVNAALLDYQPKSVATAVLKRMLWERRVESGALKGKTHEEKTALENRLDEVLDAYIRSTPKKFHVGRKNGILIRFVEGEIARDKDGNALYDGDGNEVPTFRHSDQEWAEVQAKKAEENARAAAKVTPPVTTGAVNA